MADYAALIDPTTRPQYSDIPLDSRPQYSYITQIPLTKDAFARVLLKTERGRFPLAALRAAAGGFRISPSGPMPDCEVLAALVPERVLPFASGGSRKRGLSRAEA